MWECAVIHRTQWGISFKKIFSLPAPTTVAGLARPSQQPNGHGVPGPTTGWRSRAIRRPSDASVGIRVWLDCASDLVLAAPDAGFPVIRRQRPPDAVPAVDIDDLVEHARFPPRMHHQHRPRRQQGERFQGPLHRRRRQETADIKKDLLEEGRLRLGRHDHGGVSWVNPWTTLATTARAVLDSGQAFHRGFQTDPAVRFPAAAPPNRFDVQTLLRLSLDPAWRKTYPAEATGHSGLTVWLAPCRARPCSPWRHPFCR